MPVTTFSSDFGDFNPQEPGLGRLAMPGGNSMAGNMLGGAMPGLTRLARAIAGGGNTPGGAYQRGYDGEMSLQSKLAQAMAVIQAHEAAAKAHTAQADQNNLETATMRQRPQVGDELLAGAAGTDVPTVRAWRDQVNTGRPAMSSASGDPGTDEAIGIPASPLVSSAIAQALAQRAPEYAGYRTNTKDMNPDALAKAALAYREGRLSDAIIAGTADRNTVGGAQAAAGGHSLFHTDATGSVLDQYGGGLNTDNPMAKSTIGLRGAQAGQATAGAADHYASAGQHRAQTDKIRQEIDLGGKGVLQQTDQGLLLVNPRDGTAQPVLGPNGAPAGKPAALAKALPSSAAKGYLENMQNLERAQKALDLASGLNVGAGSGDKEATGWKGYLPNTLLNRADPEGVDARAALSDIGSLVIHDRSGAAVSASEFPRLQPFIPNVRDDAATVQKKLKLFVDNYKAILDDQTEFYKGSGYNVPTLTKRNVATTPQRTTAAPAGGFTYIGKE